MISQGSSEANISFVVTKEDAAKAVKILHQEFALDRL
jgi:aspartate kinase